MIQYNKLVRDRIPEIIAAQGKRVSVRTLEDAEYRAMLTAKLAEELAEYNASGEIAELADLVEVVAAICSAEGVTWEQFEAVRAAKREERGGFANRILLIEADP